MPATFISAAADFTAALPSFRRRGLVRAPRGVVHTFWNASDGVTRYLILMTRNLQRLIDENPDRIGERRQVTKDRRGSRLVHVAGRLPVEVDADRMRP